MFLPGGGQDHVLRVRSFEFSGPYDPTGVSATPSRERIFICYPSRVEEQLPCAEEIISTIATRAFRRPLTEVDFGELLPYYRDGLQSGGFEEGIRGAITGILASPFFLYRSRARTERVAAGDEYKIRRSRSCLEALVLPLELGAGSGAAGSCAAAAGSTIRRCAGNKSSECWPTLVRRRSQATSSFQWLNLQRLDEVRTRQQHLPIRLGQRRSAHGLRHRDGVVRKQHLRRRSQRRRSSDGEAHVSERAGGVCCTASETSRATASGASSSRTPTRWGLLGKGAVLMAAAYPNRTSPVLRGAFILENIAGAPPAAPPPDVEAFPEAEIGTANAQDGSRDHGGAPRTTPTCNSCHALLDPLGLRARELRRRGRLARPRPLRGHRDRFRGGAAGRHAARRAPTPCATRC